MAESDSKMFSDACLEVLQSYENLSLNYPIDINVMRFTAPQVAGGRARKEVILEKYLREKKSIVLIRNDCERLCLAQSLVVGEAMADGIVDKKDKRLWNKIRLDRNRVNSQFRETQELHEKAGIVAGAVALDQLQACQNLFPEHQIVVHGSKSQREIRFVRLAKTRSLISTFIKGTAASLDA